LGRISKPSEKEGSEMATEVYKEVGDMIKILALKNIIAS